MNSIFNGYGVCSGLLATLTAMKIDQVVGIVVGVLTGLYMLASLMLKMREWINSTKRKDD